MLFLSLLCYGVWSVEPRQVHTRFVSRLDEFPLVRSNLTAVLVPFLRTRVSGTPGNTAVQSHLIATFESLGWDIEQDSFTDKTPFGIKAFNNIIVTKDRHASRKLTLAAHFDSKYFKDIDFIGATDSAVPCAILVDIATQLNECLTHHAHAGASTTLSIIFFDGEEAFKEWGPTDSIYGARHLAKKWSEQVVTLQLMNGESIVTNPILQMDLMVLLDLLGTKDSIIPAMHPESMWAWDRLVDIESRLAETGLVSENLQERVFGLQGHGTFVPGLSYINPDAIQDDHWPFYQLGVSIVHCIPVPFPKVWHTVKDDIDAIDMETVSDLSLIFQTFVIEYLGLIKE